MNIAKDKLKGPWCHGVVGSGTTANFDVRSNNGSYTLVEGKIHAGNFEDALKVAKMMAASQDMLNLLAKVRTWYENNSSKIAPETPIVFSEILSLVKEIDPEKMIQHINSK